jgi:hypothetical protein
MTDVVTRIPHPAAVSCIPAVHRSLRDRVRPRGALAAADRPERTGAAAAEDSTQTMYTGRVWLSAPPVCRRQ